MPEALARSDNDFVLATPRARKSSARGRKKKKPSLFAAVVLRHPGRMIAGAAFFAGLAGIAANALFMQTARHPAPIFSSAPVAPRIAQPRPAVAPMPPPRPSEASPLIAPPQNIPAVAALTDSAPKDQIGALLRGGAPAPAASAPDSARVLAAQKALVKLGYVLKPDGVMGATTRQAVQMFEQSRKMPSTGDLSPRVLRELAAQSGVAVP